MGTDNLKTNYDLIFNRGKRFSYHLFIIETNVETPYPLHIADLIKIYTLNQIHYDINIDNRFLQDFMNKIKIYRDQKIEGRFYRLLIIKIVNLSQKPKPTPATKLSDIVDPDVGMSIHPSAILTDVLNIFSIYFKGWFKQIASLSFFEESEVKLIKEEEIDTSDYQESRNLTQNINTICNLRLDQFYLLQKCLFRFHDALVISDFKLELSLVLLISSFDPAAIKYARKDLNNYSPSYLRKKFFLNYYPKEEFNELTESFLNNLNFFTEKYLHYGIDFIIPNPKVIIYFNRFDLDNKITKIPSFYNIRILLEKIYVNFIKDLYTLKDNEQDKTLYNENDLRQRGTILTKINKPKRPGEFIYDIDTYREIEYTDLQWFRNKSKYIEDLIKNGKNEEALSHIEEAQNFHLFNLNYYDCRKILYLKIFSLFSLKDYQEIIKIYNQKLITILPEENLPIFNTIAYSFAHKENFEEAHRLINKLIDLSKSDYLKSNFIDSKGEFYQFQKIYNQAIGLYQTSLEYFIDPPYDFHKETLEKLKYCYTQIEGEHRKEIEDLDKKLKNFVDFEVKKIEIAENDKFLLFYDYNDEKFKKIIENSFFNEGIELKSIQIHHFSEEYLDDLLSKLKNRNLIVMTIITSNSSKKLWIQYINKSLTSELKYSNINFIPIALSNEPILPNLKYFEFIDVNFELEQQISRFSTKIKRLSEINLRNISQEIFINLIKSILKRENFKITEETGNGNFDFYAIEYYEDKSNFIKSKNWIIEIKESFKNLRIEDISKLINLIKKSYQEFNLLLVTNTLLTTPLIEFITDIRSNTDFDIRVIDLIELRRLLYNYDDLIEILSNY